MREKNLIRLPDSSVIDVDMDEFIKILKRLADELAHFERELSKAVKGCRTQIRLLIPLRTALKTIRAVVNRLPLVESDGQIKKDTVIPLMYAGRGPQKFKK